MEQISSLEHALQARYLDCPTDRASLVVLRESGVLVAAAPSTALPSTAGSLVEVASDSALQQEHGSVSDVVYSVTKGRVMLDVRDSADCWVRCWLSEGMEVTLEGKTLRRFVVDASCAVVHVREACSQPRQLTPRFTRPADEGALRPRTEPQACRELVCELCRLYYAAEWMTGTGGAMSLRHGERIYVTPSGVAKERLQPEDLYVLDVEGGLLSQPNRSALGTKRSKLSDCAPLFLHAHKLRQAAVVIHSHGLTCNLAAALCDGQSEFRISHQEMIKGLTGHGYADTLVVPVLDNAPKESALAEPLAEALAAYPKTSAVLVRRHGLFVWGESWEAAKRHAECLHYLFAAAIEMRKLQLDFAAAPSAANGERGSQKLKRARVADDERDAPSLAERHQVVLLDIEGTTTPISFVHDVLFPFVVERVEQFLRDTWTLEDTQRDVKALQSQHAEDVASGLQPPLLAERDEQKALARYVQWNVAKDRKVGALKQLQGRMWRLGYESGELKAQVYADVPACLARLQTRGARVAIYSSGSRQAQKLLFQFSDKGDLRRYLSVYFDTKVGHKREVASYREIVQSLGVDSGLDVLFVTDVLEEAQAAAEAGLDAVLSLRPGNKPLPESHGFPTIRSFAEL